MKLTWENICRIKIVPYHSERAIGGKLGYYAGVPKYMMFNHYVELGHLCEYCGQEAIKREKSKYCYCDTKCKKAHTAWRKEWNRRAHLIWVANKPPKKLIGKRTWLERKALDPKGFSLRVMLSQAKDRARSSEMDFDLDIGWLNRRAEVCQTTGIDFEYNLTPKHAFAPSIDRINSSKGYTKDNCRLVIWVFNVGRNRFSDEDVYKMAKAYISKHGI